MARYRLIHVRGGNEIARYIFGVPETTNNSFNRFPIAGALQGVTTFNAFSSRAFANSGGILKEFPNNNLILKDSATDVAASLINGLTGYDNIRVDWSDFALDDRLYINRWDANHSYFLVTNIITGAVGFDGYTASGVKAYSGIGWFFSSSSVQYNFNSFPWLYSMDDATSYKLHYTQISLDTRDNGLFGNVINSVSSISVALGAEFWKGVKPTDNIDNTDTIGGSGSYDFEGDDIPMPDAPDETVSGVLASGFLNIYSPSAQNLRDFGGALWTNAFNVKWYDVDSLTNLILNAVSDPINFIIGLFMLPVTPTKGSNSGIYLGGINVNNISVPRVTGQYVTVDFGTINIEELYGSYLDYSYSRLSIYLPYIGMADIDVQEVTGGSVTLRYIIDCFTGACVANVKCVKNTPTPWGSTYSNNSVHSYSGNVAIQLPISAGSFDIMTQGLINVGLGLVSGQPQTVAKGATDIIQSVGGDATTRGALSSNTGKLCYQTPYLMFTRPIETRPAKLGNLHGYSAGRGGLLSSFSGYVECSDVKLDGVPATDNELNEIENILKSGVYV